MDPGTDYLGSNLSVDPGTDYLGSNPWITIFLISENLAQIDFLNSFKTPVMIFTEKQRFEY